MLNLENNKKLVLGKVVGEVVGSGITIHEKGEELNCAIQSLGFDIKARLSGTYPTIQIVNSLMDWDWEGYYEELDQREDYDELYAALVELKSKIEVMIDIVNMNMRIVGWDQSEVSLHSLRTLAMELRKELLS